MLLKFVAIFALLDIICVCRGFPSGKFDVVTDSLEKKAANDSANLDEISVSVWCNEEDHGLVFSIRVDGHFNPFGLLTDAVNEIEKKLPFSHDDLLGVSTLCPTNPGTTVRRASVHIQLPKLAKDRSKLEEVASKFNLQVRGTRGEHVESEGGVYDISIKRRMGTTENEAVIALFEGVGELIRMEKEMP